MINQGRLHNEFTISEKYDVKDPTSKTFDMPMVDILGPYNLIVTNCDYISTDGLINKTGIDSSYAYCFLLESALANRISYGQFTQSNVDNMFSSRIGPMYTEHGGSFHIEVDNPLSDSEYKQMKTDMFSYRKFPLGETIGGQYSFELYPPSLPENNGIHFYGHNLAYIECAETYGSVVFGKKSFSFEPFRTIAMKNLDSFEFYDQPVIFPLNYNPASNYRTKFRGTGKLFIEEEYQGEAIWDDPLLLKISFIVGLITGFISLLAFAKEVIEKFLKTYQELKEQ